MTRNRQADKKIRRLEREIERLKQSIDASIDLYEIMQQNNNKLHSEKNSYRRIIKYHTMLMLLMNLITSNSGDTDIGRVLKRNIHEFYISMNNDLMKIPTDNDETIDNEYEDEEAGYDEGEGYDIWDSQEEFE